MVLPIPQGWTAFPLTHIVYPRADDLFQNLYFTAVGMASLVPITLFVVYLCIFYFRREVSGLYLFSTQVLCEVINQFLKHFIKEPRPSPLRAKSFGRPSSHSQHAWFFAVLYFICIHYWPEDPNSKNYWMWLRGLLLCLIALGTSLSRVVLGYHTFYQVFEGGALGAILGLLVGFILTSPIFHSNITVPFCNSRVGQYFRLRSSFPTDKSHEIEWQVSQSRYGSNLKAQKSQ